jgi:hypothetical protein
LELEYVPWTARVYARAPWRPVYVGLLVSVVLLVVLFVYEWSLGRFALIYGEGAQGRTLGELRIAVVHCLMMGVGPTAYVALIHRTRRTWVELQEVLGLSDEQLQHATRRVGRRPPWLLGVLLVGGLVLSIGVTHWTTPDGDPFSFSQIVPEVVWHRVFAPIVILYTVWLTSLIVASSMQLSEAARGISELDLLDRDALAPFKTQALMHSLAVLVLAACASPLGVEEQLVGLIFSIWIFAALIASAGLLLPLLGIRSVIRAERERELAWCDAELRLARDALKRAPAVSGAGRFAEISAYRQRIDDVSEWALDAPSFVRFSLYLLLPLGSWVGGALVERVVDAVAQ